LLYGLLQLLVLQCYDGFCSKQLVFLGTKLALRLCRSAVHCLHLCLGCNSSGLNGSSGLVSLGANEVSWRLLACPFVTLEAGRSNKAGVTLTVCCSATKQVTFL
jgi:hypothetical protein